MPTLPNYSFVVGDPSPRPVGVARMARASVVWAGAYYTVDVGTMSETADQLNRVNVLGVVTSRRAATIDEQRTPRMRVMFEHGDHVEDYAISSIQINQGGAFTILEVQGIRDMAFRRTGETTEQMNERGLDALRELINEVTPIAEKHLPDRQPDLLEAWRD